MDEPRRKLPRRSLTFTNDSADAEVTAPPTPAPLSHVDRLINSHHHPSPNRTVLSDRFIPSRTSSTFSLFHISSPPSTPPPIPQTDGGLASEDGSRAAYTAVLRAALFGPDSIPVTPDKGFGFGSGLNRNIFRFKTQTKRAVPSLNPFGPDDAVLGVGCSPVRSIRKVAKMPTKILDAPLLRDDFYLNLVDWSSHNVLAVGLGQCVYLWNANSRQVTKVCDLEIDDDSVCSVGWAQRGTHLAVGTDNGKVQIWDASNCKRVRTMEGHQSRVSTMAWSSSMLTSGGRDTHIFQRDIRARDDFVSKLTGHKSEVCGLKWSHDNRELASGGNDNMLCVWNQHSTEPVLKYREHTAAVKAIAWSPHLHGVLASGGGTADRCIRFWNTTTNSRLRCLDTGSQVCNIAWSKNVDEIVSTHGYSQNQIIIWKYPKMSKVATLNGHTCRVLYLAVSPDGQTIVTGAGDETLRFWNVFPSSKRQNNENESAFLSLGRTQIR